MNRIVAMLTATSLLAAGGQTLAADAAVQLTSAGKPSPFYCDRAALSPEQRRKHFDVLGPALVAKRMDVRELPNGYEFRFPTTTFQELTEWIDGERACCPFFDFDVRVAAEHAGLWMRLTGRPGTKQFIQADGQEWIEPVPSAK